MSNLIEPSPVRVFTGIIYSSDKILNESVKELVCEFGEIDYKSDEFSFNQTDYYMEEMGKELKRKFIFFKNLVKREKIVDIKITCNRIESTFAFHGKRSVNIDPGYIAPEHMILATVKGYSHRIYLGRGVYADLTLKFSKNSVQYLEWTYPDYKFKHIQDMFLKTRSRYLKELREANII